MRVRWGIVEYCGRELGALSNHGNARPGHAWLPPSHPSRHTVYQHYTTPSPAYLQLQQFAVLITLLSWQPPDLPHPLSARHRLIYCHNRARFTTVIIALLLWQPSDLPHPLSARAGCYTAQFYPLINSYNSPYHSVVLISLSWKLPDTTYISKTVQYYGVPLFHSRAIECYVYYYLALVLQA